MPIEVKSSLLTDRGRERPHNEDNSLADASLGLFIVADGMGGHAAGELASQITVEELRKSIVNNADILNRFAKQETSVQEVLTLLEHAVQAACSAVHDQAEADPRKRGMGTTCSALLLVGDHGFVAHVGDSRIYLIRQGHVVQLTEDHSLVAELVRKGKVTWKTIDSSPYRDLKNAVTRAVGVYESVEVDTFVFDVLPGDCFLLCSDGLHSYLEGTDLAKLLQETDLDRVTRQLVDLANDSGGHDNITALAVRVDPGATQEHRLAEYSKKIEVLSRMPFFHNLEMKEILSVLNVTEVRGYQPGDRILVEGQAGAEMFVLLTGQVRLHKAEVLLTHLGPGNFFGELSLIDSRPRSASVTATEPTRAIVLNRSHLQRLLEQQDRLAQQLLWNMLQVTIERLRKTTTQLTGARLEAEPIDVEDLQET